ncbi:twin-arginine translocation signal domain-containing protein [Natronomonas halophila]|uniref:DUF7405 family protein n=1 Tax=Natronomonas halophila TaxID=2747817 RepID=UPI0015B426EA|nr:twin-arginine translocation signal domain-containing protein [Natronomonas halophila]QLD86417.1 twin-arginine translocation signal domain-containing protein [Natronomonas halophila]
MTRRYTPTRRRFLKAAVAVGGTAGLSACLDITDEPVPEGVDDPSTLPARQHAWRDAMATDEHGNPVLPQHHAFLYIDLDESGEPSDETRAAVDEALSVLDRAYERSSAGLLYSIGYSPAYFQRYGAAPEGVDLPEPRALSDFESPDFDTQDALLQVASDRADVVLEAEEALFGDGETANGIDAVAFPGTVAERRTGFIGKGMPAERADEVDGIPEDADVPEAAKLFMGFDAGFRGNQATEEYVTIEDGPFAGGTTKHVSHLQQRLGRWYGDNDHDSMVKKLFSTRLVGDVEGVGDNLGDNSGVVPEDIESLVGEANDHGAIGHAQKMAAANRDDEGNIRTVRRHVESTDEGVASLHFPSLQQGISTFEEVREAMNAADVVAETPAIRQRVNNGILRYIFVKHRGNFLVPSREQRALPRPDGSV